MPTQLEPPEKVLVYATRDHEDADGEVVVKEGESIEVFSVDAREICRQPGWSTIRPGGTAPPHPEGPRDPGDVPVREVKGISARYAALLEDGGYQTQEDLLLSDADELAKRVNGIGAKIAERVIASARAATSDDVLRELEGA